MSPIDSQDAPPSGKPNMLGVLGALGTSKLKKTTKVSAQQPIETESGVSNESGKKPEKNPLPLLIANLSFTPHSLNNQNSRSILDNLKIRANPIPRAEEDMALLIDKFLYCASGGKQKPKVNKDDHSYQALEALLPDKTDNPEIQKQKAAQLEEIKLSLKLSIDEGLKDLQSKTGFIQNNLSKYKEALRVERNEKKESQLFSIVLLLTKEEKLPTWSLQTAKKESLKLAEEQLIIEKNLLVAQFEQRDQYVQEEIQRFIKEKIKAQDQAMFDEYLKDIRNTAIKNIFIKTYQNAKPMLDQIRKNIRDGLYDENAGKTAIIDWLRLDQNFTIPSQHQEYETSITRFFIKQISEPNIQLKSNEEAICVQKAETSLVSEGLFDKNLFDERDSILEVILKTRERALIQERKDFLIKNLLKAKEKFAELWESQDASIKFNNQLEESVLKKIEAALTMMSLCVNISSQEELTQLCIENKDQDFMLLLFPKTVQYLSHKTSEAIQDKDLFNEILKDLNSTIRAPSSVNKELWSIMSAFTGRLRTIVTDLNVESACVEFYDACKKAEEIEKYVKARLDQATGYELKAPIHLALNGITIPCSLDHLSDQVNFLLNDSEIKEHFTITIDSEKSCLCLSSIAEDESTIAVYLKIEANKINFFGTPACSAEQASVIIQKLIKNNSTPDLLTSILHSEPLTLQALDTACDIDEQLKLLTQNSQSVIHSDPALIKEYAALNAGSSLKKSSTDRLLQRKSFPDIMTDELRQKPKKISSSDQAVQTDDLDVVSKIKVKDIPRKTKDLSFRTQSPETTDSSRSSDFSDDFDGVQEQQLPNLRDNRTTAMSTPLSSPSPLSRSSTFVELKDSGVSPINFMEGDSSDHDLLFDEVSLKRIADQHTHTKKKKEMTRAVSVSDPVRTGTTPSKTTNPVITEQKRYEHQFDEIIIPSPSVRALQSKISDLIDAISKASSPQTLLNDIWHH
jgi:hypothetical protein